MREDSNTRSANRSGIGISMTGPCHIIVSKVLPGSTSLGSPPSINVGGADSVSVEVVFDGVAGSEDFGIDVVFLIDNSGSMGGSDPNGHRFGALKAIADAFSPTRDQLDRIRIYTFNDGHVVARPSNTWLSWSEVSVAADTADTWPVGGDTPMPAAMRRANQVLNASVDRMFKMVIMLSDGWPTGTPTPVSDCTDLAGDAWDDRILYSTIYLTTTDPPDESPLLKTIAGTTDYVTEYASEVEREIDPAFYFTISANLNETIQAYRGLLDKTTARCVPQDVKIYERVNTAQLEIDQSEPVALQPTGFTLGESVISFEGTGATLVEALDYFRQNGIFRVHLNELDGQLKLTFSVKLRADQINPNAFSGDFVCVQIDDVDEATPTNASYVSYLEPTGGSASSLRTLPLARAVACFAKGLTVKKSYDGERVTITAVNVDLNPIDAVQIAEFPSGWIDAYEVTDDFGFDPIRMLYATRFVPWILRHAGPGVGIDTAYDHMMRKLHQMFGEALGQVSFVDDTPTVDKQLQLQILRGYWHTSDQRAYYRIIRNMPSRSVREMSFRVKDASSLLNAALSPWLDLNIDALKALGSDVVTEKSVFARSPDMSWQLIQPNPRHTQYVEPGGCPDLYVGTCFKESHLDKLYELFTGNQAGPNPINPWYYLGSSDITPLWSVFENPDGPETYMGAKVTVHNCGTVAAQATITANSVLLPVTGREAPHDVTSGDNPVFTASPLIWGKGSCRSPDVLAGGSVDCTIQYRELRSMSRTGLGRLASQSFLASIRSGIILTLVKIDGVQGEKVLANNVGVEIVTAKPKRLVRRRPSWVVDPHVPPRG
jgi:hypothetical protein